MMPMVAHLLLGLALAAAPDFALSDVRGRRFVLTEKRGAVVVVVVEGRRSRGQHAALAARLAKLAPRSGARLEVVAVADVHEYDYWPARHYVRSALEAELAHEAMPVLIDWHGDALRALGLHASGVAILATDGAVQFRAEGAVDGPRLDEAMGVLHRLGID